MTADENLLLIEKQKVIKKEFGQISGSNASRFERDVWRR